MFTKAAQTMKADGLLDCRADLSCQFKLFGIRIVPQIAYLRNEGGQ
jgi:hypothetical protein